MPRPSYDRNPIEHPVVDGALAGEAPQRVTVALDLEAFKAAIHHCEIDPRLVQAKLHLFNDSGLRIIRVELLKVLS